MLTAATILTNAAEARDFMMLARIAMLSALHHAEPPPAQAPRRKRAKNYKIVR